MGRSIANRSPYIVGFRFNQRMFVILMTPIIFTQVTHQCRISSTLVIQAREFGDMRRMRLAASLFSGLLRKWYPSMFSQGPRRMRRIGAGFAEVGRADGAVQHSSVIVVFVASYMQLKKLQVKQR